MLFKARIAIYFPLLSDKEDFDEKLKFVRRYILMTSRILEMEYHESRFVYYPDEAAEASGCKYDGVYCYLEREVKKPRNVYNLMKIFDGMTDLLGTIRPEIDHTEFDILEPSSSNFF